ncbi:MAG: glycosyltransferase family 39 protein [Pseudomonadota bacterium]|nr:glycosyltransferase family 39 protein [Pseudomonadota bacterium]
MSDSSPVGLARWTYPALAAFVAVMWFCTLPLRPLFNPDEGRYAEIPREMLASGDWVIPHLNGLAYVEKPPLQYWVTALALRVLGQGEFAARFYTALCALGTLAMVWLAARRLWGVAAAWQATAVLAGLLLFVVLGQLLTLDMSLTFYMTVSLVGFLLAQDRGERRWMLLAWFAAALGVLTKGLVAAAVPAAVLVLYSLYSRDFRPWRRLHLSLGLPLFLVIAVPWHWLAANRIPDFLPFFFVHEHLSRYLTPSADREEPWWFFIAVFLVGSIPWTVAAVRVAATGWRRRAPAGQFDHALFLWLWLVFVVVFFSLSDSKLIPYILPAMPALGLLIAASPPAAWRRDLLFIASFTAFMSIVFASASFYGPRLISASDRGPYFAALAKPLAQIAVLLAVSGLLVLLQRRRDPTRAAVFLGVGWCLAGMLLMRAAGSVAPVYSGVALARAVGAIPTDAPVYSVATYDQTLPFYWQRTLKLVAYRGELDFGLRHDPDAEIPSVAQFVAEWRGVPQGYAVMETRMFDDLKSAGVPMREIARDVHRVLVARQ